MFLKRIIFLFSVFIFLETSAALICKNCNVDCDNPVDELCLETEDEQEVACVTETFKDSDNATLHQRKCVLYKKDTKFECADYPGYTSISCVTCKTDRCNGISPKTDPKLNPGGPNQSSNVSNQTLPKTNRTSVN